MAKKNKFKNFMLYGGVNQEEYEQIKPVISEANLKVWKVVSIAIVILALVCLILTFAWPDYFGYKANDPEINAAIATKYGIAYSGLAIYGVILAFILFIFGRRHLKIVNPICFISSVAILGFFVFVCTVLDYENISVVFLVLLVAVSLVTVRKPISNICLIFRAVATFLVMVLLFENKGPNIDLIEDDIVYSIIFGSVAILFGLFFNYIRTKDFSLKFFVERQRDVDELTKCRTKTAFDREVSYIMERMLQNSEPDPFAVVVFNVNGLKFTNDVYGHEMGDDLLVRSSMLIKNIYENSVLFRISGDEFVIILRNEDYKNRNELIRKFRSAVYQAHEESTSLMDDTPIACGMATYDEANDMNFMSVFSRADTIMYDDKRMLRTRNEYLKNPVKYLDEE